MQPHIKSMVQTAQHIAYLNQFCCVHLHRMNVQCTFTKQMAMQILYTLPLSLQWYPPYYFLFWSIVLSSQCQDIVVNILVKCSSFLKDFSLRIDYRGMLHFPCEMRHIEIKIWVLFWTFVKTFAQHFYEYKYQVYKYTILQLKLKLYLLCLIHSPVLSQHFSNEQ